MSTGPTRVLVGRERRTNWKSVDSRNPCEPTGKFSAKLKILLTTLLGIDRKSSDKSSELASVTQFDSLRDGAGSE